MGAAGSGDRSQGAVFHVGVDSLPNCRICRRGRLRISTTLAGPKAQSLPRNRKRASQRPLKRRIDSLTVLASHILEAASSMAADDDIVVNDVIRIPRSELTFQFSRSGGPGGRNVNKVSTRVQMRWNVAASESLPEDVRRRFQSHNRRRINADGELLLTSQRYRDQPRNIEDCIEKLRELVAAAAVTPRRRRPTKPSAGARRRRLQAKREQSERKQRRRPPRLDND